MNYPEPYPTSLPAPTPSPKLDVLGIAYMLLGAIDVLWGLVAVAGSIFNVVASEHRDAFAGQTEAFRTGQMVGGVTATVLAFTAFVVGPLTIAAGLRMRKGTSYTLCLVAVVANMIPCYNTCCCGLLGIPIGIWGLIVLLDADVKASFQRV